MQTSIGDVVLTHTLKDAQSSSKRGRSQELMHYRRDWEREKHEKSQAVTPAADMFPWSRGNGQGSRTDKSRAWLVLGCWLGHSPRVWAGLFFFSLPIVLSLPSICLLSSFPIDFSRDYRGMNGINGMYVGGVAPQFALLFPPCACSSFTTGRRIPSSWLSASSHSLEISRERRRGD